jgi:Ni,Fe-hydrogenase III large subunit
LSVTLLATVKTAVPESRRVLWTANGRAPLLEDLAPLAIEELAEECLRLSEEGLRLGGLFCLPEPAAEGRRDVIAVLLDDATSRIALLRARPRPGDRYPALTPRLASAQGFERELFEQAGIEPVGHPWLKPLRRHPEPGEAGADHPFFQVQGPSIHEVAVGPVHAGVIEPGHFRFQCHGEHVFHLEIQLGYQHRGIEALMLRSLPGRRLSLAESVAGDTAIGHVLAHVTALEASAGVEVPPAARAHRAIALELERLSNHVGDLGALCNDVGYLPGASWFGRLRGDFLNLLMELSGNRFGRGLIVPGGVRFRLDAARRTALLARWPRLQQDLRSIAELTFSAASVLSRFEGTGTVARQLAEDLGMVGPVARASGCQRDVRRDHGLPGEVVPSVVTLESGDVMARAEVRWREADQSLQLVRQLIDALPEGELSTRVPPLAPGRMALGLIEGWRGEILHLAVTGHRGELAGYRIVDPSFHNWFGLAVALRGNAISDFPLCNKSFNLSYAGHDL